MTQYTLIRIDFADRAKCCFCNRPLKSCVARVVYDGEREDMAGPKCAAKHAEISGTVLDFTRGLVLSVNTAGGCPGGEGEATVEVDSQASTVGSTQAIEYLLLRQEKLPSMGLVGRIKYEKLSPIYDRYQGAKVTDSDIKFLQNLERASRQKRPMLSRAHLLWVYTCLWWTDLAIGRTPSERANFLVSLRNQLEMTLSLTDGQLQGLNNWLKRIDGVPVVSPSPMHEIIRGKG